MEELVFSKCVKFNDKIYKVLRQIPQHEFLRKDGTIKGEKFNAWKDWLGSDHVLKNNSHFIFCQTIQEIEWEDVHEEKS